MLLAAPFLLHRLGIAQYGLWMLTSAAVTSANSISTGFGDAALKYASIYRGAHNRRKLKEILSVSLVINLILGGGLAILIWYGTPYAVARLFKVDPALQAVAVIAFRIGGAVLVVRSVESVLIAALRAHERYGPAVRISVFSRASTVAIACVLAGRGYGLIAIMVGTLVVGTTSLSLQAMAVHAVVGGMSLMPAASKAALSEVLGFGSFSWVQAVAGCIFSQADRLLVGGLLGTSAVAYYSLCVQAAQPIHGLLAAGLHFLFPHLSARSTTVPASDLRTTIWPILWVNITLAILLCLPLVLFSKPILHVWMGPAFAQKAWALLSILAVGLGLLSLNVTGHYALLALGQVRLVSALNLAGGIVMLLAIAVLAPRLGLMGAAIGRLLYGPITLLMYWRLRRMLCTQGRSTAVTPIALVSPEV